MADEVTENVNITGSERNSETASTIQNPLHHPSFMHSVSRSSLTFFNSENAIGAAKSKLTSLQEEWVEEKKIKGNLNKEDDEISEREFSEKVLDYCVGGKFDLESRYVIQEAFGVLVYLHHVESVSKTRQLYLLSLLQSLLKQSIKNLQICTKVGLISKLLKIIPSLQNEKVADKAIDLVGDLATYSITVRELKYFFAALQRTDNMRWPPHALKLLEILKKMPEKHGPDVYFNFAGKPGSYITIPPILKWPHQPGFTFVTWLQLDAAHLSPLEQNSRPHIYCFINNRGLGYAAHFSGPMLVIEVWGKNGKKQTILVKSKFEPQMWYHVCISHTYNRFKSSEVKIFVNGQMVTSGEVTIPANKDAMDKCFLGGSHMNTAQHVFKGQMSASYLFSEPLAYNSVIALYRLGPGYKGNFKFRNELDSTIAETDKKLIYEAKLSQSILFTYNPKAVDGELCLESSPAENPSCFYHSPHAMMMDGVHAVVTHSLQAAMHSLGGIQMLFPLFTQLDCPLEGQTEPEPKICSILLGLVFDLLRGSAVCQQQMIQSQGFMVIGHLLQKASPVHLTEETVDILLGLARYFMATSSTTGLLGGLLDHVLLEPSLWIKTPLSLQSNLLSLFATGYVGGLDYAGYIRKEVGVPRLVLMLRKYYSIKSPGQKNLSSAEEVISLRAFVLLLVKQMIIKDKGVTEDELKSILVYLAVEEEEENYLDVIQLLLSVMCEIPGAIVSCFDMMEGFQVFFKLLVAHEERIRICSLKILCAYLQQLTVKRKLELVERYAFIAKIGQKLSIFDMTIMTYNALFELLTARPTKIISEKRHASPDNTYVMYHPSVLPIIVSLLLKGRVDALETKNEELHRSNVELTTIFLSDLVLLLTSNNDNKRLLLQLICWQDWLFSLAYYEPNTKDEHKITDNVFSVVKMLLYYAIQHEKEGWRVWVDTLSILHGKVTDDIKKEHSDKVEISSNHAPTTVYNERRAHPEYIDQETGELKDDVLDSTSSTNNTVKRSPIDYDLRKQFFEHLLNKGPGTSVLTGTLDGLRRAQSADNINEDKDREENASNNLVNRPRSASPSLDVNKELSDRINDMSLQEQNQVLVETSQGVTREDAEVEEASSYRGEKKFLGKVDPNVAGNNQEKKTGSDRETTDDPQKSKQNEDLEVGGVAEIVEDSLVETASEETPMTPNKQKTRPYIDIPEFNWSQPHQRLLSELLFFIEKDIHVWKTHTRKTMSDFVSSRENNIYIMNLCHMTSILSDSLVFCCGGLLPLVASATSQNFANDVLEACGGMTLDTAFSFLNRVLDIIDIVVFASTMNFASVESHRNLAAGGVLRQCIRLVFCGAARNRVVCRQRERPQTGLGQLHPKTLKETQEAIKTLIASTKPPTEEDLVQNIPGHMTTIMNPERLLQDPDINRLRALVYREVEDSRQSQYVALVVIYFVAVLMVARYRDILQQDDVPQVDTSRRSSSASGNEAKPSPSSVRVSTSQKETQPALTLEEQIDSAFNNSAALLREILFDYSHYLMKVLVGSRGQDLISDGLGSLKSEESTVELVMLLCSQEWQNALQRQAGTAFMDLVDEGRLLSHTTRERIVITGSEAKDIMNERENMEKFKLAQFESVCTRTVIDFIEQYKTYDQFFKAKKKRNASSATQSLEKIFDVLTCEFGAWSLPEVNARPEYYKLDKWEDMQRRRRRIVKNPFGTSHPQATLILGSAEVIPPEKPAPLKYHLFAKKLPSTTIDDISSVTSTDNNEESSDKEDDSEDVDLDSTLDEKQPYQQQGSIVTTTECHLVSPGALIPGTLAITSESLYFTADEDSEELKKLDTQILMYNDCLNVKCSFINIVAIFSRRYILQPKAIEIFLANRRSFMFAFTSHDIVKKVIQYLPAVGVGSGYGFPRSRNLSHASPRVLFNKSNMLQRWQKKEVTNFEYLMFLNTIAGRTYNDLNQYFVFPWVLRNYESKELDLNDPNNYRDLSKPIGALNPFRLAQFVERFNSWDDTGDAPPFHYGTHYSTAGFVMNWLVRLEPYASLFLCLQGGKFDHPLRTFSSIKRVWDNCQSDTSDVKELIPELYYLPEMLRNDNKFVFGDGEDGDKIDHVILPPWARSPDHFIKLHREALESEYVSENLHKWIDLIFGYKQKGRDAEHNANVFYYLTYEGSVDLDRITDPVTKEALIQQISSFGQTPAQLLTTPHPPRSFVKATKNDPHKSIFLSFSVTPEVPVTHVTAYTSSKTPLPAIITISCNQFFSVNKWINFGGNITSYQSLKDVQIEQDPSLETIQGRLRRQLGEPLHESITVTSHCFTVTSDNKFIFACGYWDKSFKCFSTDSGKLHQCIFGHWDVVTCLAYSDDELTSSNAIIVSGSLDATVLVWIWDHRRHQIIGPEDPSGHGSTPIAICTGHELPVTCVDVNTSVGIIASGSVEGACLIHSLSGELLWILKGPSACHHPRLINISNEGRILVNYSNENGYMAMFSYNGRLLSYVKLTEQNLSVVFTKDGCFFVTGGFSRCFQVWRSFDLVLLSVYPACDGSIRSLALSPDQKCMVAGLSTGSIIAMAMDFSMWPRISAAIKPVETVDNSQVISATDNDATYAKISEIRQMTAPTASKIQTADVTDETENKRVTDRTPSSITQIINGVPIDAAINPVEIVDNSQVISAAKNEVIYAKVSKIRQMTAPTAAKIQTADGTDETEKERVADRTPSSITQIINGVPIDAAIKPVETVDSSQVISAADNEVIYAKVSKIRQMTAPTASKIQTADVIDETEKERVADRTSSSITQIIHGVPIDDADDATVSELSDRLKSETTEALTTKRENKSSNLMSSVPDDDVQESRKTLLQTVKEAEKLVADKSVDE